MKIAIVGTGYVGLVSGTCFAEMGVDVTCVDVNTEKIANLEKGIVPIYEPGLDEMVLRNHREGRLHFTTDLTSCLDEVEVVFSAVGTPPDEDGSADLSYVLAVAHEVGANMNHYLTVVTKSTVRGRPHFARPETSDWSERRICGSSALNGSSKSHISESIASARAIATRCFMPPESWFGYLPRLS